MADAMYLVKYNRLAQDSGETVGSYTEFLKRTDVNELLKFIEKRPDVYRLDQVVPAQLEGWG